MRGACHRLDFRWSLVCRPGQNICVSIKHKLAVGMFYPIVFAGEPPQRVAHAVRLAAMRVGQHFQIEEQTLQAKVRRTRALQNCALLE